LREKDRRTDRILIARPRLHSIQRGKNERNFDRKNEIKRKKKERREKSASTITRANTAVTSLIRISDMINQITDKLSQTMDIHINGNPKRSMINLNGKRSTRLYTGILVCKW